MWLDGECDTNWRSLPIFALSWPSVFGLILYLLIMFAVPFAPQASRPCLPFGRHASHVHLNWLCRLICLLNRALPNPSSTVCLPSAVQIGSPDRALSWFVCVLIVFAIPRAPPQVFSIVGRIICCSDHRWTPNLSCSHILLLCTLWFLCCLSIYINPVVHAAYSWSGSHPFFPAISHAHMFM